MKLNHQINYEAKFYRTNEGATTGFAILGELYDERNSELTRIYWDYPREDVEVSWESNYIVINDVRIKHLLDMMVKKIFTTWLKETVVH